MTVSVIHCFKTIKIHKHQSEVCSFTVCFVDRLAEAIFQQNTIRQPRQRIVKGQLRQFSVSFSKG
ncbi:hypothetical protein D3C80_1938300 [compost metagenome]